MVRLCIALLVSLSASNTLQDVPVEQLGNLANKKVTENTSLKKTEVNNSPVLNIKPGTENKTNISKQKDFVLSGDVELNKNNSYMTSIEPGADLRLLSLISFVVLICLLFIGCRIYRNRKMPKIIKKYGERKRRTDVEMAPLPLHNDDDEEDETLFDLGNVNAKT